MKGNSFKVSTPTKFDKIRNALEYSNFIEKMATSYGDPYKTRMQKLYNKDNAGYLYVGYDYEHGLNDATDLEKYKSLLSDAQKNNDMLKVAYFTRLIQQEQQKNEE